MRPNQREDSLKPTKLANKTDNDVKSERVQTALIFLLFKQTNANHTNYKYVIRCGIVHLLTY